MCLINRILILYRLLMHITRSDLGYTYLYDTITVPLNIESLEYYYPFPLLKETINYWGYTSTKICVSKEMTQQASKHINQLTEWYFIYNIYYKKSSLYISNIFQERMNRRLDKYYESRTYGRRIINIFSLLKENNPCSYGREYSKTVPQPYEKETEEFSEISKFFDLFYREDWSQFSYRGTRSQ